MKYPLLHPIFHMLLGVLSLPLIALLFYYQPSAETFAYILAGVLSGIAINETWFMHVGRDFTSYKRILKSGKGYERLFRGSSGMLLAYAVTYAFSISVFFGIGETAFIAVMSGLGLTGLVYYGSAKKFYRRL